MRKWAFALLFLAGCSAAEQKPDDTVVALEQVPEAAMKAAKEKLPGVTFDTAWKTETGAYEIRGKDSRGKIRDLQVTESGEVLEVD